jgi:hypothetical protein
MLLLLVKPDPKGNLCVTRQKGDKDAHKHDCRFGQPAHPTANIYKPAFQTVGETLSAFINLSITSDYTHAPTEKKQNLDIQSKVKKKKQQYAKPNALINKLFLEKRYNYWEPGLIRTNLIVFGGLKELVRTSMMNNAPMDQNLYIPVEGDSASVWEKRCEELSNAKSKSNRKTIVLGEIDSFHRTSGEFSIKLKGIESYWKLSNAQFKLLKQSFPRIWAQFKRYSSTKPSCRFAFVGIVSVTNGQVILESVCFRLLSLQYIPSDSFHEVKMTHKLVKEARKFFRVLSPTANGSKLACDFELLDMKVRYLIEVFGMNHPLYRKNMKRKIKFWTETLKARLMIWSAWKSPTIIPKLPRAGT